MYKPACSLVSDFIVLFFIGLADACATSQSQMDVPGTIANCLTRLFSGART